MPSRAASKLRLASYICRVASKMPLALYLFVFAIATPAQTMHIGGGYDGLIDDSGVGGVFVETWLPDGWDVAGGIRNDGSLGFTSKKVFPFGKLTLGDSIIQFTPIGVGVIEPLRGVALATHGFVFFLGAASDSFTEPFLETQSKFDSLGLGFTYSHKFSRGFVLSGTALTAQHKTTALLSASEQGRHYNAYFSAGELLGHKSLNYGLTARYSFLFGNVARSTLMADNLTTNFTTEGGGGSLGPVSIGGNHYASETVSGDSVFTVAHIGDNTQAHANYLTAQGERVLDIGFIQKLGERFTVSPGATRINGAWSWTVGGTFASNLATVSASYEEMFLPFAVKNPWQKTLLVSVALQLPHSARATVRSVLLPTGRLGWTAYADKYLTGPMGETQGVSGNAIPNFQKFVLSGIVVDEKGLPVFGAAVKIGRTVLFTDSAGMFEMRAKQNTLPLSVDVEEFSVGRWRVVDCPATATAGEVARIVVAAR
jgi:hypothetical protein